MCYRICISFTWFKVLKSILKFQHRRLKWNKHKYICMGISQIWMKNLGIKEQLCM